jgi:hypothetical protein
MMKPDRREEGVQGDLFRWADSRPKADVIDFMERRELLPRWILARRPELEAMLLRFDRRAGLAPPASIFPISPSCRA